MRTLPIIRNTTFWDVNPALIDFEKRYEWVICRVFNRGNLSEVKQLLKFYGWDKVKHVLLNTDTHLQENAIDLAQSIFYLQKGDFKCLSGKPFLRD